MNDQFEQLIPKCLTRVSIKTNLFLLIVLSKLYSY